MRSGQRGSIRGRTQYGDDDDEYFQNMQNRHRGQQEPSLRDHVDAGHLPPPPDVSRFSHERSRPDYKRGDKRFRDDDRDDGGIRSHRDVLYGRANDDHVRHRRSRRYYNSDDENVSDFYGDEVRGRRGPSEPTDTIIMKGFPDDMRERDLHELFAVVAGVKDIRKVARRRGRDGLPIAFIEFETVERSVSAMERALPDLLHAENLDRVECDYAQPLAASKSSDWVCVLCKTLNFSRRDDCIKCRSGRDEQGEDGKPTRTICIRNMADCFTEEDLKMLVANHGIAQNVRLMRTRGPGPCRTLAYITFASVSDAEASLQALDGLKPQGQATPFSVTFASDRVAQSASLAVEAVAAAAAMNSYSAADKQQSGEQHEEGFGGWQPRPIPKEGEDAAANEASGASATTGFVFDEASGYYYDAASGYFYDARSQLYYHPTTKAWYRHNLESGEYDVIPAEGTDAAHDVSDGQVHNTATVSAASDVQKVSVMQGGPQAVASRTDTAAQGDLARAPSSGATARTITTPASAATRLTDAGAQKRSGGSDLVNQWLKQKADEQRKAARDFLKKPTVAEAAETGPSTTAAVMQADHQAEPGDSVSGTVVRQKVYAGAGAVDGSGSTITQTVAGGVVRGKVYSRKGV